MSNYFRRLCALFLSTFLFLTFSFSVFADDSENTGDADYKQKSNFFHWISKDSSVLSNIVGYSLGALCPETEDGYHRASSYQYTFESLLGDTYFRCICTECGEGFNAYETDLKQSYETQVSEMPATGYNSDGSFLIRPKLKWMSLGEHSIDYYGRYSYYALFCPHFVRTDLSGEVSNSGLYFIPHFDCDNWNVTALPKSGYSSFDIRGGSFLYYEPIIFPVDGFYSMISSVLCDGYSIKPDNLSERVPFSISSSFRDYKFRYAGDSVEFYYRFDKEHFILDCAYYYSQIYLSPSRFGGQ